MAIMALITSTQAQNVNFPDTLFKAALVNNSAINTNGDGEIQLTEANTYNGSILVAGLGITDLTGIEAFVAIDSLDCSSNTIWGYDQMTGVYIIISSLSSLNVSANTALTYLNCSENSLPSVDVSANMALTYLGCAGNQLNSLDVSANMNLTYLNCARNYQLTGLNISAGFY